MKKSKKNIKEDNIKEEKQKKKFNKKIVIPVVVIAVACISVPSYMVYKDKEAKRIAYQNKVIIRDKTIESGSKVPVLDDFVKKYGNLDKKSTVSFVNSNKDVESKDLTTKTIYYDKDKKEVNDSDALDNGKLKDGYTSKTIVTGTGTYKVTIKNNKKTYTATLNVKDTKAPTFKTKDVTITEGDSVSIDNFIESCTDNSSTNCIYKYVDDKGNEIDDIDKTVGEHTIKLIAKDESGNKTESQDAKLVVNAKPVEESAPASSNTSSRTSTTRSSGTRRSVGSSGTSSNGSWKPWEAYGLTEYQWNNETPNKKYTQQHVITDANVSATLRGTYSSYEECLAVFDKLGISSIASDSSHTYGGGCYRIYTYSGRYLYTNLYFGVHL